MTDDVAQREELRVTVFDLVGETLEQVDMIGEGEDETLLLVVVEEERHKVTVLEVVDV